MGSGVIAGDPTAPLWTQAEVLTRLPWWIAQEFNCVYGPHHWREIETCGTWGPALLYQICLYCPARRKKELVR